MDDTLGGGGGFDFGDLSKLGDEVVDEGTESDTILAEDSLGDPGMTKGTRGEVGDTGDWSLPTSDVTSSFGISS